MNKIYLIKIVLIDGNGAESSPKYLTFKDTDDISDKKLMYFIYNNRIGASYIDKFGSLSKKVELAGVYDAAPDGWCAFNGD